jgi:nitroimidazol reductase NimA-like FMN-containing flavoprotein (pyridoxamine 5'-phosphate oxidase superfamily)
MTNIRLTRDEAWAMLDEQRVGIFTSLRGDGCPISLPTWFAPIDRRIYLHGPVRAKKFARVRNNPRVAFVCESGERWVDLRAVHFTGVARIVEDHALTARVSEVFDLRYAHLRPPRAELPESAEARYRQFGVIEIAVDDRILSWDNARFGLSGS